MGGKVLERAGGHACGPYRVPNVDINAVGVHTNNPPCGAMRGFGANQANFGIEGCMDMLADKAGLDGWEIRWRNAVDLGDLFSTGQILDKSVGIRKTLLAVKDRYYGAFNAGRAIGISCGIKNTASATVPRSGASAASSSRTTAPSRSTTATPRWGRGC